MFKKYGKNKIQTEKDVKNKQSNHANTSEENYTRVEELRGKKHTFSLIIEQIYT